MHRRGFLGGIGATSSTVLLAGCTSIFGEPAWIEVSNQTDSPVDVVITSQYLDGERTVEKKATLRGDSQGPAGHTSFSKMFVREGKYRVAVQTEERSAKKTFSYEPNGGWRGVRVDILSAEIEIYPMYA